MTGALPGNRVKAVQAAAKQDRRDQQAIHAVELAVARDEKVKALRDQDTAWQIEHTRQMREQAAESRAKLQTPSVSPNGKRKTLSGRPVRSSGRKLLPSMTRTA